MRIINIINCIFQKESAEDFKATFGENWREESTSLFNLFSDEFGEIPLR
jgi:hypothetical protein